MSLRHGVNDREVATLQVLDAVRRQLCLPLLLPVGVLVGVVLGCDDHTSLVGGKVRDDVAPTFVVVDAQRDDEVLASGAGHETKGAARSATTHREYMGSTEVVPRPAISVFPDSLLDDVEVCVRGLVDTCSDCVTHSRRKK